jgi:hypothetical protein
MLQTTYLFAHALVAYRQKEQKGRNTSGKHRFYILFFLCLGWVCIFVQRYLRSAWKNKARYVVLDRVCLHFVHTRTCVGAKWKRAVSTLTKGGEEEEYQRPFSFRGKKRMACRNNFLPSIENKKWRLENKNKHKNKHKMSVKTKILFFANNEDHFSATSRNERTDKQRCSKDIWNNLENQGSRKSQFPSK